MHHQPRLPLPLLLALALASLLPAACEKPQPPPRQAPLVTIASPVTRDVTRERVYLGETRPAQVAEVRARVQGFLQTIDFEVGHDAKAGDVLFTIQKEEFAAQVEQARATLAINRAELNFAQADFERVEKAAETNAVSVSDVGLKRAERDKAAANIDAASAALAQAELNLSYTDVRAPIDGRLSRNLVDLGNLVGAGEATLLTTLVELDPIHVYFEISEREFTRYLRNFSGAVIEEHEARERYSITVALEGDEGFPHEGWVDFIENTADSGTGTVQLRAVLPNPNYKMYPGLFARIRVPGQVTPNAVLVRESAIQTDLAGKYMLLVGEQNIVVRRYVTLGQSVDDLRVIEEGLQADEEYIADGLIRVRPGMPVRTQTEAQASDADKQPAAERASQAQTKSEGAQGADGSGN